MVNVTYSTEMLRNILDGVLAPLWAAVHCSIKDLWELFARYTYLPRFKNMAPLISVLVERTARIGWEQSIWALAAGVTADGSYADLVAGSLASGVNGTWLLVRPNVATPLMKPEPPVTPPTDPPTDPPGECDNGAVDPPIVPPPVDPPPVPITGPTRFWGRKNLNPAAAQMRRDFE